MTAGEDWPLGKKRTQALRRISAEYGRQEGGSHGPDHTERVYRMALAIGRRLHKFMEVFFDELNREIYGTEIP